MLRRKLLRAFALIGGLRCVAEAQSPITIRQTITLVPQLDVFRTDVQPYTLGFTPEPGAAVMLFWSGELLLQDTDYTLTGSQVTVDPIPGDNPVVQVMYWRRS